MSDFVAVLTDNASLFARFFWGSIKLFLIAGAGALLLGTLLAALRVSPVPAMRVFGTLYVNTVRNTPLTLVLVFFGFAAPKLGIPLDYFPAACIGLILYTAAFVCEAVRSGINAVPVGQAEAARSVGMTFAQTLRLVVLPQAARAVVPPLASTLIAMTKNSSIAVGVGVTEATFMMRKLTNDYSSQILTIFIGFAIGYMILVGIIATASARLERRQAVA